MTRRPLRLADVANAVVRSSISLQLWKGSIVSLALVRTLVACGALIGITSCGGTAGSGSTGGGGGGNPATVTLTFRGATPVAVAARIGSGAFTKQTLNSNVLTLSIPNGTSNYAVAFGCPELAFGSAASNAEFVIEASILDGTALSPACPSLPAVTLAQMQPLTGSVDASAIATPSQSVLVAAANGNTLNFQGGYPAVSSFSLPAPVGEDRVMVLLYDPPTTIAAARDFKGQVVPGALNGGNPVIFSTADKTTSQPVTYNGVPAGYFAPTTHVYFELGNAGAVNAVLAATSTYPVLPASATESGDYYFFLALAQNSTNPGELVFADATSNTGGPISFTFPPPWTYAGPTPAALPSITFQYAGITGKPQVTQGASMTWVTTSTAGPVTVHTSNFYEVTATANYQNGATTLNFPDLSGVTGFLAPPASGSSVNWWAGITQYSFGLGLATPVNASWSGAQNTGTYTVP